MRRVFLDTETTGSIGADNKSHRAHRRRPQLRQLRPSVITAMLDPEWRRVVVYPPDKPPAADSFGAQIAD